MEIKSLRNGKLKRISSLMILAITILISCDRMHITKYGYLEKPPLITSNEKDAINGNFIGIKFVDESVYYIYAQEQPQYTYSYKKASKGYIFEIKNLRISDSIFADVDLDGDGDTLNIRFFDKRNMNIKTILFYGRGKINSCTEYKNGKKLTTTDYYNGNIEKTINWDINPQFKNARDGVYEEFDSEGNLILKGYYKKGFREGMWIDFDRSGDTLKKELWINGRHINENGDTVRVLLGEKLDTIPCVK